MAELADALGSGPSSRKGVRVQIPFPAYATFGGIDGRDTKKDYRDRSWLIILGPLVKLYFGTVHG